jgi:putative addiction module component (TIGR02574 family)
MSSKMRQFGIDHLSVDERIDLMHEIWDSIVAEPGMTHMTPAQQLELQRRLTEHETDPEDTVSWEEVKVQALERFRDK